MIPSGASVGLAGQIADPKNKIKEINYTGMSLGSKKIEDKVFFRIVEEAGPTGMVNPVSQKKVYQFCYDHGIYGGGVIPPDWERDFASGKMVEVFLEIDVNLFDKMVDAIGESK